MPAPCARAQVNEEELTATALLCYFKAYTALYAAGDLPQPKTVVNATAEANNAAAKANAFKTYTRAMERQCSSKRMLSDEQFQVAHKAAVEAALSAFDSTKKMGGKDLMSKFKESLSAEITDSHKFFLNVRASARACAPGMRASTSCWAPATWRSLPRALEARRRARAAHTARRPPARRRTTG